MGLPFFPVGGEHDHLHQLPSKTIGAFPRLALLIAEEVRCKATQPASELFYTSKACTMGAAGLVGASLTTMTSSSCSADTVGASVGGDAWGGEDTQGSDGDWVLGMHKEDSP